VDTALCRSWCGDPARRDDPIAVLSEREGDSALMAEGRSTCLLSRLSRPADSAGRRLEATAHEGASCSRLRSLGPASTHGRGLGFLTPALNALRCTSPFFTV